MHQNINNLVSEYLKSSINNAEAAYAIKVLVLPEIMKIIDNALFDRKEKLGLKVETILSLPVLVNGKAISMKLKNGKYVERKLAPASFISKPTEPQNRQAWFEFNTAIQYIVNDVNQAFDLARGGKNARFRRTK